MEHPDKYTVARIEWQFFGTLTFKQERLPDRVRASMLFAFLRTCAGYYRVHFKKTLWCGRMEAGEMAARLHYHVLMAGFPPHAVQTRTCFAFMEAWRKVHGGHPQVRVFNPNLDGVDYVLKGAGEAVLRYEGNDYELTKFGTADKVTFSESCLLAMRAGVDRRNTSRRAIGKAE